jgi:hypothetical protein
MSATATPETEKIGFSDFVEKLEEVKSSTAEIVEELPIDNELKTNILISVEENIKQVLFNLASKNEYPNWIDYRDKDGKTTLGWGINITAEEMKELPNSITGILVHYLIKGIRDDFGYEFEKQPKCLTYHISKFDKKISGKKRLLTKEQKNELLARTQMSFYDKKISDQEITIEDAMYSIKDAYEEVKRYEEMGYILPPEKSKSPYWFDQEKTGKA